MKITLEVIFEELGREESEMKRIFTDKILKTKLYQRKKMSYWLDHLNRMLSERMIRKMWKGDVFGKRKRERLRKRWTKSVEQD